jgi:orotate phosphoribosyltransferase-like protein
MAKKRKIRNKVIIVMKKNGATYQEIADELSISRQRAHEIYVRESKKLANNSKL